MPTNAPVGPPTCTREPPSAEIKNPAMMAVYSPAAGIIPQRFQKFWAEREDSIGGTGIHKSFREKTSTLLGHVAGVGIKFNLFQPETRLDQGNNAGDGNFAES